MTQGRAVGFHSLKEVPDAVVVSTGGAVGALGQERERVAIARLCPIDKKRDKKRQLIEELKGLNLEKKKILRLVLAV